MKNFISVLIFGALLTITACQKDLEVVQSSTKNTQTSSKNVKPDAALSLEVTKQADCYYGVYVDNGMLAFSDANHFKSVLECLEQQVQANNQAFADQYPNLSDDDFTNVLEKSKFNEFTPLKDFESNFAGYKSLRSKVEALMPAWLSTPNLDLSTYPRSTPVIGHSLRTLVNENNQVKVGNTIVDFTYNIGGNSANLAAASCGIAGFKRVELPFDNDKKKLIASCALLPALFGTVVQGEAHLYKKNRFGGWSVSSTKMYSKVIGTLNNIKCNRDHDFVSYDDVRNWTGVNPRYRAWFRIGLAASDQDLGFVVELPNYGIFHTMNVDVWY